MCSSLRLPERPGCPVLRTAPARVCGLGRHGEPSGFGTFDDGEVQVAVVEGDLVAAAAQAPGQ
ncbi:hypothetical protein ACIPSE_45410 [Streptomyces sp. NPDC090106]|uniref:hypothetical protein n=1 Tax=Streptomyces sp. NPDC090106 TaxID=3365946 RepID=UPI0037F2E388